MIKPSIRTIHFYCITNNNNLSNYICNKKRLLSTESSQSTRSTISGCPRISSSSTCSSKFSKFKKRQSNSPYRESFYNNQSIFPTIHVGFRQDATILTSNGHNCIAKLRPNSFNGINSQTRMHLASYNLSHRGSELVKSLKIASNLYIISPLDTSFVSILNKRAMSTSANGSSQSKGSIDPDKPKFNKTKEELKAMLTPLEYKVTQEKATERPFTGEYNEFKEKGTYHCVVCQEELFTSDTKFESGCGWPSFFDSIDKSKIKYVKDYSLVGPNILLLAKNPNLVRTEILCSNCNAHLGHVFDDGPKPTKKRYCVNSASLRFTRYSPPDSSIAKSEK